MKKIAQVLILAIIIFSVLPINISHAQNYRLRVGILGDSLSDEYRGDDNRGGSYAAHTLNWDELMSKTNRADFGIFASRSEPRRIGYEFNYARSGYDTAALLASSAHNYLANDFANGKVDVGIIFIGANDFNPKFPWLTTDKYGDIYNSRLTAQQLTDKVNAISTGIDTMINTLKSKGMTKGVVVKVTDYGYTPFVKTMYPDANKRQLVTDIIDRTNTAIDAVVRKSIPGVQTVDLNFMYQTLIAEFPNGVDNIDGEIINLFQAGDEPHNGFLSDGVHPGTIVQTIIGNFIIDRINIVIGDVNIPKFTSQDMLTLSGIKATTTTTPVPSTTIIPISTTPVSTCSCIVNTCSNSCVFGSVSNAGFSCSRESALAGSPTQVDKNSYCTNQKRRLGDADASGAIDYIDYLYYVRAVNGGTIPTSVNPDFNGDGFVTITDRGILIANLK